MVINITSYCDMECSHCMNSCNKTNYIHMTEDVFSASLDFCKNHVILISGGEPTSHPDFDHFISIIRDRFKDNGNMIIITTNGEWILKNKDKARDIVNTDLNKSPVIFFQITTDNRFYPRKIDINDSIFKEPGFELCINPIQKVYPLGRAVENNLADYNWKCSHCYNLRALCSELSGINDFDEAVSVLESNFKFCTPMITPSGELVLGESIFCTPVGSIIDDSKEELFNKIRNFTCKICEDINKKSDFVSKNAIKWTS